MVDDACGCGCDLTSHRLLYGSDDVEERGASPSYCSVQCKVYAIIVARKLPPGPTPQTHENEPNNHQPASSKPGLSVQDKTHTPFRMDFDYTFYNVYCRIGVSVHVTPRRAAPRPPPPSLLGVEWVSDSKAPPRSLPGCLVARKEV